MNNWIPLQYRHWTWLAGFAVVFILVALLALSPSFRSVVNGNQGVVSAILTAMLVVLYFGQFHIQSRQLRFQNAPHVEIQEYDTDGKQLEIWLSNLGNGVATDIEIETCIDFAPTDDFAPGCASARLRRVGEDGNYKRRVGNSLKAGEHDVRFIGELVTEITPDKQNDGWGLVAATGNLAAEDIRDATLTFFITSEDLLGREDREKVFGWSKTVELQPKGVNIDDVRKAPVRETNLE